MTQSVRDIIQPLSDSPTGSSSSELNITRIPLVGEGRVLYRVDQFYETLCKDWREELSKADLVLCAAHSQGTPVGTLLLNRLVTERLIDPTTQRIGLLGMAGICHGKPFAFMEFEYIHIDYNS
jgi:hypothetical protein